MLRRLAHFKEAGREMYGVNIALKSLHISVHRMMLPQNKWRQ